MQSELTSRSEKLHVGIIMDGNGRWATRRGLSRVRGHEAGVETIRRFVEVAPKQGIGTLTRTPSPPTIGGGRRRRSPH